MSGVASEARDVIAADAYQLTRVPSATPVALTLLELALILVRFENGGVHDVRWALADI